MLSPPLSHTLTHTRPSDYGLLRPLSRRSAASSAAAAAAAEDEEERRAYAELAREGFLGAGGDKAAGGKPKKVGHGRAASCCLLMTARLSV